MDAGTTGRGGHAPPVFGRTEAVGEILRVLDAAREGVGHGLLLVGPSGIGKSHILRVAADRALERGFRVLSTRALPEDLPAPFTLLRELLRSDRPDPPEAPEVPSGDWAAAALPIYLAPYAHSDPPAPFAPAAARGSGGRSSDEIDHVLFPPGTTASDAVGRGRQELIGRAADYFRDGARSAPLLLAVDDLEFADGSSLDVLRRLAAELHGTHLALIATAAEGPSAPDRTRPAIEELRRAATFRTATLRPFGPMEVGEFVRWIQGGRAAPPADVLRWHAQTDGNPLFIEQVVRSTTVYAEGGTGGEAAVGRDVAELLRARYATLEPADRRLLAYAAVLGKEFSFADLAGVVGTSEERATEGLDRLVHAGLLRERGSEVYEFVSEAVRAGVYSELTETRRRILHQRAGRSLEERGGASDSELARQFYLGRDEAKAVEYNTRAGQAATRAYAFDTAVSHFARALEAERRRPDRALRTELGLLIEIGRLQVELGSLRRADETFTEAVEGARGSADVDLELGRALLGLAQTRSERSDFASAASLASEAAGIPDRAGAPRDLIAAHRILGTVSWRLGRNSEAEAHQRAALAIAERAGTPAEIGHALIDLANRMVPDAVRRLDPALALYGRAAELFALEGDQGARARVLMNRAALEYMAGRVPEALSDLESAIGAAERSGSPVWIGYCYLNLSQIEAEQGRPESARRALERCVEALDPLGDRLASQQLAMTRGMVAEAEGAYDAAEIHYADSVEQAKQLGTTAEVAESLLRLVHLLRASGDLPRARQRLEEARATGVLIHHPNLAARAEELEAALRDAPDRG